MTAIEAESEAPVLTQPGVYDIPDEVYHADPVPGGSLSSTGARKLLPPSCPAKFRYEQDHPVHKAVFDLGRAAHLLVLGTGAEIVCIDAPDWRTSAAKDQREAARAEGKTPLLPAEHQQVQAMAAAIREHPVAGRLLDPERGTAEQSLFWQDGEFGIWCRARLDWMRDAAAGQRFVIADYKTADCAEPGSFARSAANFGYHQQDAFYCDGICALGLADDPAFVFVVQEKNPPYLVSICELDEADRRAGRRLNHLAAEIFRDCKAAGVWPGYSTEINHVSLPAWARARNLMGDF
jgi:PDDEXK-like domain of unknown function (DUF3799)